jgi:hypothetical protein
MHRFFISIFAVACASFTAGCNDVARSQHPDRGVMSEQERCSVQADKIVKKYEEDTGRSPINPQNHFDPRTGVCIVSIYSLTPRADNNLFEEEIVTDAFEHTVFGKYEGVGGKVDVCTVTLPSGELKECKDRTEFEKLMEVYIKPGL